MAGDWIKMRGNLWDDPRVARICDKTDHGEAPVIGALYWLWATADQHTEDGIMPGLTLRAIDRKTGIQGFADALCDVGWLADHPEGVRLVRFEEHNGESAKRRCVDAKRKANVRKDSDKARTDDGQEADALRRISELEKELEIEKEKNKDKDTKTARKRAAPAVLVSLPDLVADGVDEQHATDWLVARKAKGLPLTPTAWDDIKAEAIKARITPGDAIKAAAGNGWAGFKAAWLQEPARNGPGSALDRKAAEAAKWMTTKHPLPNFDFVDMEASDAAPVALR